MERGGGNGVILIDYIVPVQVEFLWSYIYFLNEGSCNICLWVLKKNKYQTKEEVV